MPGFFMPVVYANAAVSANQVVSQQALVALQDFILLAAVDQNIHADIKGITQLFAVERGVVVGRGKEIVVLVRLLVDRVVRIVAT